MSAAPPSSSDPDYVASLARGLAVIEAFRGADQGLTLAEASRRVGFDRAAVRRMLKTLTGLGYVTSEAGRYQLTPRVLSLAVAFLSSNSLPSRLQPVLEHVNETLDESCSAAVLDGTEIVYVARAAGRRIMSVGLSVGSRLPAHCTSMGRVLLAEADPATVDSILADPLRAMTPRTETDRDRLKTELRRVRAAGFAVVDEELELGLRSIAVPVRTVAGRTVAAMNVSVQAGRVSVGELETRILPVLREAAARIGPALGA
jgi:IclR family pca regulon transcriptional regulator